MHYRELHIDVSPFHGLSSRSVLKKTKSIGIIVGPVAERLLRQSGKVSSGQDTIRFVTPGQLDFTAPVKFKDLFFRAQAHNLSLCPAWLPGVLAASYDQLEGEVVILATEPIVFDHKLHLLQLSHRRADHKMLEGISLPPEFSTDTLFAFVTQG